MKLPLYDTCYGDDFSLTLVKEKEYDCVVQKMSCPETVAKVMNSIFNLGYKSEEHCYMLAFNAKCRPLGVFFLSKGTINTTVLSPREVFMKALLCGAEHIILIHNHPSKDTEPSIDDMTITRRLVELGEMLAVKVADHLIIGGEEYYSFKAEGMLTE